MSAPTKAEDWIAKAEEDLAIALPLLRRKKLMTYGITFHAQQCAEKYLKALVVKQGVAPIKTHDLVQVASQCLSNGILVPISTKDLQILADYGVRSRYPGDDPTPEEAKEALEIAKAVRKFAKTLL